MFDKAITKLITYPAGKQGAFSIPAGTTAIESWAFENCWKLTSVSIPKSVREIGYCTFALCTGLETVLHAGSQEEWNQIEFSDAHSSGNAPLLHTKIYFNGEKPPASGPSAPPFQSARRTRRAAETPENPAASGFSRLPCIQIITRLFLDFHFIPASSVKIHRKWDSFAL